MKKIYLLFLGLITITSVHADIEPSNNTPGGAEPIAVNGTLSGTITAGDYDFYEFTTVQDGDITISCNSTSPSYTYANLTDSDGATTLASVTVNSTSGTLSIVTYQLAAGHYYIYVLGNDSANYTLSNSLSSPAIMNDIEPNTTASSALLLALGDTASGHIGYRYNGGTYDGVDFYQITIPVDGDITMNIDNDRGTYIGFGLIDSDGTTNINNLGGPGLPGMSLTTVALAAGTYYIRVSINLGTEYCGYHLMYSFQPTAYINDIEPNNAFAQAVTINLNDTTTGHIMHRIQGGTYDVADWYRIVLPTNGNLSIPLTGSTNNFIGITLYDSTGSTNISSAYGNGQTGVVLTANNLLAGTYFIKIYANLGTEYNGYQFSSSLSIGIDEISSIINMELFPNPVAESLNLKFMNSTSGNVEINIVNMNGEICFSESVFISGGNSEINIPVKNLPEGMYMVEMISGEGRNSRRFVK